MLDAGRGGGRGSIAPDVDEELVKRAHDGDDAKPGARTWPRARRSIARPARRLGDRQRSAWSVDGRRSPSRANRDEAARHLRAFSGQAHAAVERGRAWRDGGQVEWSHVETRARSTVRPLSRSLHRRLSRRRMAGSRLLRRRVPDGGPRRDLVRPGRGQPLHHPWECRCCRCSARLRAARIGAVMTSAPYAEVIGDPIDHSLLAGDSSISGSKRSASTRDYRSPPGHPRRTCRPISPSAAPIPTGAARNVTMPLKLDARRAGRRSHRSRGRRGRGQSPDPSRRQVVRRQHRCRRDRDAARPGCNEPRRRMGSVTLLGNGGAARAALVALKLARIDRRPDSGARPGRGDQARGRIRARRRAAPVHRLRSTATG